MKNNQIVLIHGRDYIGMTVKLLEETKLDALIGTKDKRIALKPNLVAASQPKEGAVTHPEIVEGTIKYLQGKGYKNISVIESSWIGARTMQSAKVSGIGGVCERYGVEFVDLKTDGSHTRHVNGMELSVCNTINDVDFLINMPVLKGHCQTVITCALKNAKGVIPDSEKRRYHTMGLHKPIAHLNKAIKWDYIIVDNICGDLDFEEGGNPVVMNRIFACVDPVLCDAYVCETMGYSPDEVEYIRYAEELGVGSADLSNAEIVMLNEDQSPITKAPASRRVNQLAQYIEAKDACSACYGSLIYALNRLHEQGQTKNFKDKVCIGQGYKGKAGAIGVGACTHAFNKSIASCPPSGAEMLRFLEENWCD